MKWSASDHHESGLSSLRVRGAARSSSESAAMASSASARPRLSLISISMRFTAVVLVPQQGAKSSDAWIHRLAAQRDEDIFDVFDVEIGASARDRREVDPVLRPTE